MKKFLYFRDVADEDNDTAITSSISIPTDSVAGMVPITTTQLSLFLNNRGLTADQQAVLTVTRGKLQEVMQEIVAHINGYTHNKNPLTVIADASTTDVDASTRSKIFFSNDVTGIAFTTAKY